VLAASTITAESTSETSENFYQTTQRNIPEDSHHLSYILILSPNILLGTKL
jgi:hypothetical protein